VPKQPQDAVDDVLPDLRRRTPDRVDLGLDQLEVSGRPVALPSERGPQLLLGPIQRLEARLVGLRPGQALGPGPRVVQPGQQPVLRVDAARFEPRQVASGDEHLVDAERRRSRRATGQHALGQAVPLVVERVGDRAELLQRDPPQPGQEKGRAQVGILEQRGAERRPAIFEGDLRADLVRHLHERWQARLDRMLRQHALRERVEGADGRGVEVVQRLFGPRARRGGRRLPAPSGRPARTSRAGGHAAPPRPSR
jgi:hypothetical protein